MKRIVWLVVLTSQFVAAQKLKKADKVIVTNLQTHIGFLADDKLEGRRTGSAGEKLAYEYISGEFGKTGLTPKGDNGTFIQAFEVNEGKQINPSSHLIINGFDLDVEKEYFPFIFSPNASLEAAPSMALRESGTVWFWDLKDKLEENKTNPHFDLTDAIKIKVNDVATKGATGLIIYNTSSIADDLKFEPKAKSELVKIPVLYVTQNIKKKYLYDETATIDIKLKVDIGDKKRMGHNIVGYIDNGAATTVILGAHYDHLGYGEDHNSLYTGTTPQIHNGADDNASGTAALLELSKLLKASKFKNNNYLFVSFSGEELGLFGSKYFTEHPAIDLSNANYMINMDMVGRLNDSTHGLTIGGYGTSPVWGQLLTEKDKFFTIKFDSSGTGPSDHTSFYRKDIPVLFFFTGVHSDYHKPSDDADKINYTGELQVVKYVYNIIDAANKKGKLAFTKTREAAATGKNSFKVSLGIMPDYTFSGGGVRVDGVSEGKMAQKIGIKAGDIIVQLGDIKFSDVQSYMGALGKFNKGDATKVKVKRGNEELLFDIVF
ncbi:M28 family peptidase [Ferruginibacter sp. SUN106]|uniref:M28 family peptidase n=1 Tax=Ferruginibacter sp. SUN106 TaxID=2978348 RepID=UPI003D36474F